MYMRINGFCVTLHSETRNNKMKRKHLFDSITSLFAVVTFVILSFTMCTSNSPKFHIEGHINGAKDTTLYLEALTLNGIQPIDSTRLTEDGAFTFAYADTTACPEFYRLRIGGQVINLSIDSTETIGIEAQWPNMAFNYTVTGSGNCDTIRILSLRLANLEKRIVAMSDNRSYTLDERTANIEQMVKEYKDSIKIWFIQNRYDRASSYYALFQTIGQVSIFDVQNDASDVQWANAIANAWDTNYPGCLRTQNLCNIALRGRQNTRHHTIELNIDDEKVKETGIIDMGFPDLNGRERRLSQLKGQVVLLDFTAYSSEKSQDRIMLMRGLYDKYHGRGLEIYQVSLDPDEHYWKTVSANLPWICVYNAEGIASDMVTIYQVQQINTYFLIDRGNNLVSRAENIPDLEKAIEALL